MKIAFNLNKIHKSTSVYKAYSRLINMFPKNASICVRFDSYTSNIRKNNYIVCANIWQVLLTSIVVMGSDCKIIFWVQGAIAEESFLRNRSKLRFVLLKAIEHISLYLSDAYIFVSPYMKDLYSKRKYVGCKPSLVVPCISDLEYHEQNKHPYSFCYLGGMSKWQCFPETLELMNKINEAHQQSTFKIATNDLESCKKMIKEYASEDLINKIQLLSLESKTEIESFLSECSYGFLLREDILLNNIASPIKLAEYLSCGVNIITTKAVRSYAPFLGSAGIILDTPMHYAKLIEKELQPDTAAALKLYKDMFSPTVAESKIKQFITELEALIEKT